MSRPPNQRKAGAQACALLVRTLPGSRRGTVRAHVERAQRIAACIWRRWQVGPWQWRVKHLRWYLVVQTAGFAPSTRYRYWLTVRAMVCALCREDDWLPHLQGPWLRSTGQAGALKIGRPPKLPQPASSRTPR